jgi:hypothetical protein
MGANTSTIQAVETVPSQVAPPYFYHVVGRSIILVSNKIGQTTTDLYNLSKGLLFFLRAKGETPQLFLDEDGHTTQYFSHYSIYQLRTHIADGIPRGSFRLLRITEESISKKTYLYEQLCEPSPYILRKFAKCIGKPEILKGDKLISRLASRAQGKNEIVSEGIPVHTSAQAYALGFRCINVHSDSMSGILSKFQELDISQEDNFVLVDNLQNSLLLAQASFCQYSLWIKTSPLSMPELLSDKHSGVRECLCLDEFGRVCNVAYYISGYVCVFMRMHYSDIACQDILQSILHKEHADLFQVGVSDFFWYEFKSPVSTKSVYTLNLMHLVQLWVTYKEQGMWRVVGGRRQKITHGMLEKFESYIQ